MLTHREILDLTTPHIEVDLPPAFSNHRIELVVMVVNDEKQQAIDTLIAKTKGAWKGRTIEDIDQQLERSRQDNWDEL